MYMKVEETIHLRSTGDTKWVIAAFANFMFICIYTKGSTFERRHTIINIERVTKCPTQFPLVTFADNNQNSLNSVESHEESQL